MLLSIALLALILGIMVFQASQGAFSAAIMAVLTICCAAGAIGSHEWVAAQWLAPYWKPSFANALALGAGFGVPLIILRLVTDKLIRRSALLPSWVDRIGGGVCGLVSGLVIVGVLAHALQMLPFGGSVLGYSRVQLAVSAPEAGPEVTPPALDAAERELFFQPDRFAVGLTSLLSTGVFSGPDLLSDVFPDKVQAVGWVNGVFSSEISRFAPPRSIAVAKAYAVPFVYAHKPAAPRSGAQDEVTALQPRAGHEFQMVRVRLQREARDEIKSFIFTLRQFRLVGRSPNQEHNQQYFPVALQENDPAQAVSRHIRSIARRGADWPIVDEIYEPREGNNNEVEVVFELPKGFRPAFIEYKGAARAPLTSFQIGVPGPTEPPPATAEGSPTAETPPTPPPVRTTESATSDEAPEPPAAGRTRTRGGRTAAEAERPKESRARVRGAATTTGSSFTNDLPMSLRKYRQQRNVELSRDRLRNGHVIAFVDEQEAGTSPEIRSFEVPDDKRLLHLNTQALAARSGLGRALSSAVTTVQNYYVEDTRGNRYVMIGKYATAELNGRRVFEVQYFPDQAGLMGAMGKFEDIREDQMSPDDPLVLLFLVDPGVQVARFSTGSGASRDEDLLDQNLTAPP